MKHRRLSIDVPNQLRNKKKDLEYRHSNCKKLHPQAVAQNQVDFNKELFGVGPEFEKTAGLANTSVGSVCNGAGPCQNIALFSGARASCGWNPKTIPPD